MRDGPGGMVEINAHGIAVYGTDAAASLADVRIDRNELDHLVLGPAGSAAQKARLVLNHNRYAGRVPAGHEVYDWNGTECHGLATYRAAGGQDPPQHLHAPACEVYRRAGAGSGCRCRSLTNGIFWIDC